MDTFLVIAGGLILIIGIATFILFKFNNNIKIGKVPLKYILAGAGILILVVSIAILKTVYGKNTQKLEDLLLKLKKSKADGEIKVIDEKISNNVGKVDAIDKELDNIKKDYNSNQSEIKDLEKQKQNISNKINELDQKNDNEEGTLEDKVNRMKDLLGEK